jgi:hypothetical protein
MFLHIPKVKATKIVYTFKIDAHSFQIADNDYIYFGHLDALKCINEGYCRDIDDPSVKCHLEGSLQEQLDKEILFYKTNYKKEKKVVIDFQSVSRWKNLGI